MRFAGSFTEKPVKAVREFSREPGGICLQAEATSRNVHGSTDEALKYNNPLCIAYYSKEEPASLRCFKTGEEASPHFTSRLVKAENSVVQVLENT